MFRKIATDGENKQENFAASGGIILTNLAACGKLPYITEAHDAGKGTQTDVNQPPERDQQSPQD